RGGRPAASAARGGDAALPGGPVHQGCRSDPRNPRVVGHLAPGRRPHRPAPAAGGFMKHLVEDSSFEQQLRSWGTQARADAPPATMPVLPIRSRSRRLGPIGAGALLVAAAALVGTTLTALPGYLRHDHRVAAPPANSTASKSAGNQVLTFHGLSVTVPASWPVVVGSPCRMDTDLVILPGPTGDCSYQGLGPPVTVAAFSDGLPLGLPATATTVPIMISGVPATRQDADYHGRPATGITVSSVQAA